MGRGPGGLRVYAKALSATRYFASARTLMNLRPNVARLRCLSMFLGGVLARHARSDW